MRNLAAAGVVWLALGGAAIGLAQTAHAPSADDVRAIAAKYRAERDHIISAGIAQRFPPAFGQGGGDRRARRSGASRKGDCSRPARRFGKRAGSFRINPCRCPITFPAYWATCGCGTTKKSMPLPLARTAPSSRPRRDHTVKIWDLGNGHEILTYIGHGDDVSFVAFNPDNKSIASAGADRARQDMGSLPAKVCHDQRRRAYTRRAWFIRAMASNS